VYEEEEDASTRSFFSEIVSSISDVRFSHSGVYMTTRDYMTAKVWDVRMESRSVETYSVHDYLRGKLCTLYENDSIFDKFDCIWSNSDRSGLFFLQEFYMLDIGYCNCSQSTRCILDFYAYKIDLKPCSASCIECTLIW